MLRLLRLASGAGTQLLNICTYELIAYVFLAADLNAYLLQAEGNIADFAAELGCTDVEQRFRELAADRWAVLDQLAAAGTEQHCQQCPASLH
jgi:hypothetical protein